MSQPCIFPVFHLVKIPVSNCSVNSLQICQLHHWAKIIKGTPLGACADKDENEKIILLLTFCVWNCLTAGRLLWVCFPHSDTPPPPSDIIGFLLQRMCDLLLATKENFYLLVFPTFFHPLPFISLFWKRTGNEICFLVPILDSFRSTFMMKVASSISPTPSSFWWEVDKFWKRSFGLCHSLQVVNTTSRDFTLVGFTRSCLT